MIHAPSYNSPNHFQWGVSDFQIGFDPCICNKTAIATKLGFRFDAMTTMNINMSSRSISVEQPITNNNFLEEDYLNLSDYSKNYKSGSRMYGKMTGLLTDYNNAQQKYQSDLANYNSPESVIKRKIIDAAKLGLTATGKSLGGNIAENLILDDDVKNLITKIAPRVSKYSLGIIDLNPDSSERYTKDLQKAAKGLISSGFDLLSTQLNSPGGPPSPPSPSIATYTETTYSGTIDVTTNQLGQSLIIPGSIPISYPGNPGIDKVNYPAYNEVLGLFALLETPKMRVKAVVNQPRTKTLNRFGNTGTNWEGNSNHSKAYEFILENKINYRFNHVVDFDFNKTKLYYSYRIKLKNIIPNADLNQIPTSILNNGPIEFINNVSNQTIMSSNNLSLESYNIGADKILSITTPFSEVKTMLNEPFTIINSNDIQFIVNSLNPFNNNIEPKSFNMNFDDFSNIESIEIKLMADMYFISKGSKEQDLNTLQTFTYKIYQNSGTDNQMPSESNSTIGNVTFLKQNETFLKHQSGNVIFDNIQISPSTITAYTHHLVNATEMHIYVENAILKNNITVAPGFTAYIHFLGSAVSNPESTWEPELVLDNMKSEDLYNYPFIYEATDIEVADFCGQSNKYKANESLSKTANNPRIEPQKDKDKPTIQFNIYPNPANDIATVLFQLNGAIAESICIYNLAGALVQKITLTDSSNNQLILNTLDLAAGVYLVTLNASNGYSETKKLIIAK
ncbi:MAG: T9SS type A sorting domain-containing protein [Bacteroidia bacterium]